MLSSFYSILPFVLLVGVGFGLRKLKLLPFVITEYLGKFVLFLSLPAVLLKAVATAPKSYFLDLTFIATYGGAAFATFLVTALISHKFFTPDNKQSVFSGLISCYSNIGFLAVPLFATAIGAWTSVPLAIILIFDLVIMVPFASFLLEWINTKESHGHVSFWKPLRKSLLNPMVIAILIGIVIAVLEIQLPLIAIDGLSYLGMPAGPLAMFIVGASLARQKTTFLAPEVLFISTAKLILFPLIVAGFTYYIGIDRDWAIVTIICATMPPAAILGIFAERYRVLIVETSSIILLTTILTPLLFPIVMALFYGM